MTASPGATGTFVSQLRRLKTWALALVSTIAVGLLLAYLAGVFHPKVSKHVAEAATSAAADAARVEVRRATLPRYETAVGSIEPVHAAQVASKLLARVVEVNIKAGQVVREGEVLFRLDDVDLRAREQQALAETDAARAQQEQAAADLERAERLRQSRSLTEAEYDRLTANARRTAAEAQRAAESVREAQALLSYATITAPLSGVVVDKRVEVGDTVSPGQVLVTMYDPARMQMVANVRESLALSLKVGQKLTARLESLGYECDATVSEVVPQAQVASRSFVVKVTGPCPTGVYSGMFGRLYLPLGDEQVTVVPAAAIRHVGQLALVDLLVGDRVQRRSVQVGRQLGNEIEILSGLAPGETVLIPTAETRRS